MIVLAKADLDTPAAQAGITIELADGDNVAWFTIPAAQNTPSHHVDVRADGTNLKFFPERSSAQRQLLKRLGVPL